jgi:hypothetical protein
MEQTVPEAPSEIAIAFAAEQSGPFVPPQEVPSDLEPAIHMS